MEGIPTAEVASRFGYTPGSFRVLVHEFRNQPERDFFIQPAPSRSTPGKQNRLREQVIALRKQAPRPAQIPGSTMVPLTCLATRSVRSRTAIPNSVRSLPSRVSGGGWR